MAPPGSRACLASPPHPLPICLLNLYLGFGKGRGQNVQPLRILVPRLLPKAGWALWSWVGPSFHLRYVLEAELGDGNLEQIKNSNCVILIFQEERKGVGTPSEDVSGFVPRSWSGFQASGSGVCPGYVTSRCLSRYLGAVGWTWGLAGKSLCGMSAQGLFLCPRLWLGLESGSRQKLDPAYPSPPSLS